MESYAESSWPSLTRETALYSARAIITSITRIKEIPALPFFYDVDVSSQPKHTRLVHCVEAILVIARRQIASRLVPVQAQPVQASGGSLVSHGGGSRQGSGWRCSLA